MLNAEIPFDNDIVCIACAFGYTDDVRQFLAHGADVAAENYRALQLAIENGSTELVRLFLELPFDPSVALFKSLNIAIQRGFTEIIRLLLETRGVSVGADDLAAAIFHNHPQIVQMLLSIFPNEQFDEEINCAFLHACEWGYTEIVRLFLEKGGSLINPSAYGNQAFRTACARGCIDVVRLLLDLPLERGVDPAANDNYAFRFACENGQTEIARLLLDLPLERGPTAADNHALKYARKYGRTDIVRLLLERGIAISVRSDNFSAPDVP
jgi:ankyrin repeat protein